MSICLIQREIRDLTGERMPQDQIRVLTELNIPFVARIDGSVAVVRATIGMRNNHLRQQWRKYWEEYDRYTEELGAWQALSWEIRRITPQPESPKFPEELRGLTCGAKTRKGTFCKRKDLYANGRCRMHGGPSTGPTSEAGKQRSALNGRRPKVVRGSRIHLTN